MSNDVTRCQAILLTKPARGFSKHHTNWNIRCQFNAKDGTAFCGVHKHLNEVIHAIIWRDQ